MTRYTESIEEAHPIVLLAMLLSRELDQLWANRPDLREELRDTDYNLGRLWTSLDVILDNPKQFFTES